MSDVDANLAALGHTLPEAPAPAANYVPFVISGKQVFVSGQVPMKDGDFVRGKVGRDMSTEDAVKAAELCALVLLAQAKKAAGGFENVARVVKLVGFVNSTPDYTEQPLVINGASDLMVAALGEKGRHARSAVSAGALPLGVAVEIEAIFELK